MHALQTSPGSMSGQMVPSGLADAYPNAGQRHEFKSCLDNKMEVMQQ